MTTFIIRSIIALATVSFMFLLFATGYWGWGIVMVFPAALVIFSFFRNERVILALNQMRIGNLDKAQYHINKITAIQFLPKRHQAYVLYLQALLNSQINGFAKTEQMLRRAMSIGLKNKQDNAMARMQLAGICLQTNRRQEATTLLAEAKKLDNGGMLKDQIADIQRQMKMGVPTQNQMRMAQMGKGRMKMPRR